MLFIALISKQFNFIDWKGTGEVGGRIYSSEECGIIEWRGKPTPIEEMYGPVSVLSTFTSSKEALEIANSSGFRLTAAVWTQDIKEISYFKILMILNVCLVQSTRMCNIYTCA